MFHSFTCVCLHLFNTYLLCAQHTLSSFAGARVTAENKSHWYKGSFPEIFTILPIWSWLCFCLILWLGASTAGLMPLYRSYLSTWGPGADSRAQARAPWLLLLSRRLRWYPLSAPRGIGPVRKIWRGTIWTWALKDGWDAGGHCWGIRKIPSPDTEGVHRVWVGCHDGVLKEEWGNVGQAPAGAGDWPVYLPASFLMLLSESVTWKSVCSSCKSCV